MQQTLTPLDDDGTAHASVPPIHAVTNHGFRQRKSLQPLTAAAAFGEINPDSTACASSIHKPQDVFIPNPHPNPTPNSPGSTLLVSMVPSPGTDSAGADTDRELHDTLISGSDASSTDGFDAILASAGRFSNSNPDSAVLEASPRSRNSSYYSVGDDQFLQSFLLNEMNDTNSTGHVSEHDATATDQSRGQHVHAPNSTSVGGGGDAVRTPHLMMVSTIMCKLDRLIHLVRTLKAVLDMRDVTMNSVTASMTSHNAEGCA
jgi:hypothetical protein